MSFQIGDRVILHSSHHHLWDNIVGCVGIIIGYDGLLRYPYHVKWDSHTTLPHLSDELELSGLCKPYIKKHKIGLT